MSIRVEDLNATNNSLTGAVNALVNARDQRARENYNKKMAALERLKFDTSIGDVERQRQMSLLRKYDDDSMFGGIKEMLGMYDTKNPIVANTGDGIQDVQTGGGSSVDNTGLGAVISRDNKQAWMDRLKNLKNERTKMDDATYNRLEDARGGSDFRPMDKMKKADAVEFKDNLSMFRGAPNEILDSRLNYRSRNEQLGSLNNSNIEDANKTYSIDKNSGLDRAFSANNQPIVHKKTEQVNTDNKKPSIKTGDVNSYYQSANEKGLYRDHFEGSFSDMHKQNLEMYQDMIDEAVARKDWKTAEKLNREYRANVQAIDKSWQYERGKGEFIELYKGKPSDGKGGKVKEREITVYDKTGKPVYTKPLLTDWEARHLYSEHTQKVLAEQGIILSEPDGNGNRRLIRTVVPGGKTDKIYTENDEYNYYAQSGLYEEDGVGLKRTDGTYVKIKPNAKTDYERFQYTAGVNN